MAIASSNHAAFGKHVDDRGHEQPPVSTLVIIVEQAVFAPGLLVFEQRRRVALHLLVFLGELPYAECEEGQEEGKHGKGNACEELRRPRIPVGELEDAVQSPNAIEQENQIRDGAAEETPVPLAETSQLLRERSE